MSGPTQSTWEELPSDPDIEEDLGYVPVEFEVIRTEKTGDTTYLFLPDDEELLLDQAYIVADEDAIRSIGDCR